MTATDSLSDSRPDSLSVWLRVRREVDWRSAPALERVPPGRDGFRSWCCGPVRRRNPIRAERLLAAHALAREDAARLVPLDFALLARWQREVLGTTEVPAFRTGDAYAKGGRERYGLSPHTWSDFDACLREAADPGVPLAARGARVYLDVAFFHPFSDGNARAALLTLVHVLARDGIVLPEVGPLQITRYADDPAGAADLAALIGVLNRRTMTSSSVKQ
ncbi:Fic family protein [Actinospica robiniae]|uniref:Fic family protein n=1 Tax=Actinospica robiniae TaxID=304901 RepID=UPI0012FAF172|nr:Fic family protein [Actinospica robiniae]